VGVNQYRGALLGSSDASAGPLHSAAYSAADALFHLLIEGEERPDRFLAAVHKLLWPAPGRDPEDIDLVQTAAGPRGNPHGGAERTTAGVF